MGSRSSPVRVWLLRTLGRLLLLRLLLLKWEPGRCEPLDLGMHVLELRWEGENGHRIARP